MVALSKVIQWVKVKVQSILYFLIQFVSMMWQSLLHHTYACTRKRMQSTAESFKLCLLALVLFRFGSSWNYWTLLNLWYYGTGTVTKELIWRFCRFVDETYMVLSIFSIRYKSLYLHNSSGKCKFLIIQKLLH